MEDKRETRKELDLDQVEEVTGGKGSSFGGFYKCNRCGKAFSSQLKCQDHERNCTFMPGLNPTHGQ